MELMSLLLTIPIFLFFYYIIFKNKKETKMSVVISLIGSYAWLILIIGIMYCLNYNIQGKFIWLSIKCSFHDITGLCFILILCILSLYLTYSSFKALNRKMIEIVFISISILGEVYLFLIYYKWHSMLAIIAIIIIFRKEYGTVISFGKKYGARIEGILLLPISIFFLGSGIMLVIAPFVNNSDASGSDLAMYFGSIFAIIFGLFLSIFGAYFLAFSIYGIYANKLLVINKTKKYNERGYDDLNSKNSSTKQKGEEGEAEIKHVLSWLNNEKYKVFNNVHVRNLNMNSDQEKSQQFDHIVIGTNGIFHIETKNYDGDIEIDKDGSWTRIINGERKGWESPLFQVQRHRQVLENIFGVKYPIVDIVAIANTHSNIIGKSNAPYNILKADNLKYFIENYKNTSNVDIDVIEASKELTKKITNI